MENELLKVLASTLKSWPSASLGVERLNSLYIDADIVRQTDGRVIIVTRYPEDITEVVTEDMWHQASTRKEMIQLLENSDIYFGNETSITDIVDFLREKGYGKIT